MTSRNSEITLKLWNKTLTFSFKILSPYTNIWAIWPKKDELSNLNEILHRYYFKGSDFNICLQKYRPKMPKFGYSCPEIINFLILIRVCLYLTFKVLISNLALVSEDFGILYLFLLKINNFMCNIVVAY